MQLSACKQVTAAFKECGYGSPPHADVLRLADETAPAVMTTHICEEVVGITKNYKEAKSVSRYRKLEVCFARSLAGGLLQKRFDYQTVDATVTQTTDDHAKRLPNEQFHGVKANWSGPWREIQSPNQTADFESPSAVNNSVSCADIYQLRNLEQYGHLNFGGEVRLNKLFQFSHNLIFQVLEPNGQKQWVLPVHPFDRSATFAIKVKPTSVCAGLHTYYELQYEPRPYLFTTLDLDKDSLACTYVARSWTWQWQMIPAWRKASGRPAIRPFRVGSVAPVFDIACNEAFWLICKADINMCASYLGIHVPPGAKLLQTLVCVISSHLKISEVAAVKKCWKRLARMADATKFSQELLQLDEAAQCIGWQDMEQLHKQQERAFENLVEQEDFGKEFQGRIAASVGGGDVEVVPAKPTVAMPPVFEQKTVKKYIPSTATCWRGNTRGEWWGHQPPYSRVPRKIADFDSESECILSLIQRLWKQHNKLEGKPLKSSTIIGLFSREVDPDTFS